MACVLRAAPINVARIVREALFDRYRAVVLTSATLAVDGSFTSVKGRLGLRALQEPRGHQSSITGRRRCSICLAGCRRRSRRHSPKPWPARPSRVTHSQGRAFVLFTSYKVLHAVRPFIEMALPYPMLVQGTAPRSALLDEFRARERRAARHLQLLAGRGRRRRCAELRDDRQAAVRLARRSGDRGAHRRDYGRAAATPSREYQVPLAILALQQGLGRLIRHRGDRGVLAILDPRLRTMGYGRRFLASLPPAPVTYDLCGGRPDSSE